MIQNVLTENYLYQGPSSSIYASILLDNPGTSKYNQYVWRIVSAQNYGNNSSYRYEELTSDFSISEMVLDIDGSKRPTVNRTPTGALWTDIEDFTFSKNNTANYNGSVTINNTDHTIKGAVTGAVSIRATYKVTGLTCDFSIDVRALLEKQADYSLPEDIKEKLFTIRSLISQIQASDSSASDKSIMIGELELQEDLIRADYILTGDNYQSDYAQSVIPNFLNIIDNSIETVSDDLYRVIANRLLVLFGLEFSNLENNNNAYFLDIDCAYDEWTAESQSALNWYFNGTTSGNFFNRTGSQITPVLRTVQLIRNLQIYRYHHDMVKKFVANNVGGTTEVTIKEKINENEYKVFGRADIMKSHSGGTYVWEVKPNKPRYYGGKIGTIQLTEYIVKANNSNFVVSKGDVIFETLFSAGMPVTPFNLTIPDFTDDDLTTCLKVTPSPYAESILYENGLILYQEIDESDGDLQTYDCTQTQLSLLNENATIVAPSTVKVGVRDLVYTMAFGVVEGVVIGICIISAPYMMPSVSEVLSGTATSGTVTAVTSAIAGGSVVVTPLSTYSIGMINNMVY